MQSAKKAAETVKETAANVGASAKSGMEKTKAVVQEKMERMTAHNPMEKEMATQKKEERIHQAEVEKQEGRHHNAAARQSATSAHTTGTGEYGQPMGTQQMPAMHGHGTGQTIGNVTETETGMIHKSRVGGHGTGGGGTYN